MFSLAYLVKFMFDKLVLILKEIVFPYHEVPDEWKQQEILTLHEEVYDHLDKIRLYNMPLTDRELAIVATAVTELESRGFRPYEQMLFVQCEPISLLSQFHFFPRAISTIYVLSFILHTRFRLFGCCHLLGPTLPNVRTRTSTAALS